MNPLTALEIETLTLLAAGERSADIAAKMGITPATMRRFKQSAAHKLGLVKPSDIALANAARPYLGEVVPIEATTPPAQKPKKPKAPKLPPAVRQIAATYPPGQWDWKVACQYIDDLVKQGHAASKLASMATQYRRQQAAQQAFDRQAGRKQRPPLTPTDFFSTNAWQGPFPMPVDPLIEADERESAMSNEEWLASDFAKVK